MALRDTLTKAKGNNYFSEIMRMICKGRISDMNRGNIIANCDPIVVWL